MAAVVPSSSLSLLKCKRRWYERNGWINENSILEKIEETSQGNYDRYEQNYSSPRIPLLLTFDQTSIHPSESVRIKLPVDDMEQKCKDVKIKLELDLGITEITGEAGAGKTQLCLSMCASCANMSYQIPRLKEEKVGKEFRKDNSFGNDGRNKLIKDITHFDTTSQNERKQNRRLHVSNPYLHKSCKRTKREIDSHASMNRNMWKSNKDLKRQDDAWKSQEIRGVDQTESYLHYYQVMYVSIGEGVTQSQIAHRLHQMLEARQRWEVSQKRSCKSENIQVKNALKRILTKFVRNEEDFMGFLINELPRTLESTSCTDNPSYFQSTKNSAGRIGLIILDSIAGVFRISDEQMLNNQNQFYSRRSESMFKVSALLRKLSEMYCVPIVVVNQVTTSFCSPKEESSNHNSHNLSMKPALGLSW
eukprot:CAMPEP_0184870898 /NCGR_PEP_ID=MMETSP0580-20130426/39172_1 /TAXON_ID=1118495 /ORGANISM="Dactyliosolen fragilissimus" /LENGTH=418 /DNA_ID=CAMNT_0027373265 /DNA_START=46 /DNA_END=1299 /DNA_ORIENTATION=-